MEKNRKDYFDMAETQEGFACIVPLQANECKQQQPPSFSMKEPGARHGK
jgi:hypothetical protein